MKCSHFLRVSFTFNFRYLLFLAAAKYIYTSNLYFISLYWQPREAKEKFALNIPLKVLPFYHFRSLNVFFQFKA